MKNSKTLCLTDFLNGAWRNQRFTPFREGIEICHLHEGTLAQADPAVGKETDETAIFEMQPSIALLRYAPGASVPRHRHPGVETILVLDGSQTDENGQYPMGCLVINPVDSEHSVWSTDGCVVFIQWDKPVEFI